MHADADIEADEHEHDAQQEGHAPSPTEERVFAGEDGHHSKRAVSEDHARRRAELREAGGEAAPPGIGPLSGDQHRAAPFTADADALQDAEEGQEHGTPDSD